jgi:RNase adapter protein RapZ
MLTIMSCGEKYGLPHTTAPIISAKGLHNPYWDVNLRYLNGLDERVQRDILSNPRAVRLAYRVAYTARKHGDVVVYCTGGRHRSVTIVEKAAEILRDLGHEVCVVHRDLERAS